MSGNEDAGFVELERRVISVEDYTPSDFLANFRRPDDDATEESFVPPQETYKCVRVAHRVSGRTPVKYALLPSDCLVQEGYRVVITLDVRSSAARGEAEPDYVEFGPKRREFIDLSKVDSVQLGKMVGARQRTRMFIDDVFSQQMYDMFLREHRAPRRLMETETPVAVRVYDGDKLVYEHTQLSP
jgi:hypothetical protein